MSTFLVVDTANTFSRASFVAQGSGPEERGAMALHIMLNGLAKAKRSMQCDHIVFCLEGRSWRRQKSDCYKANRDEARRAMLPKEVEEQQIMYDSLNDFITFVRDKTNCTVLQHPECEADDLIARWTQLHPNDNHIILSSDSDFRQLVTNSVSIYDVPGSRYFCSPGSDLVKKIKSDREIKLEEIEDPEYFLFKKIIRGDSSDNIFSAYPKIREKGSKNKVGIIQAFEDRKVQGYDWTNFMSQTWIKPELNPDFDPYEDDDDQRYINKTMIVKEQYELNKMLIDLTAQPQNIKDSMDLVIATELQREPRTKVGFHFAKFCNKYDLVRISEQLDTFAHILNAKYSEV